MSTASGEPSSQDHRSCRARSHIRFDKVTATDTVNGPSANISEYRKIIVMTEGQSRPHTAKTAISLLRYRADDVVAVLDSKATETTAKGLFGVGGEVPVVDSISTVAEADAVFLGTAVAGGKVPTPWRAFIIEALSRGLDIVSGMHEFLIDDREFADAAAKSGARITDVRKNNIQHISTAVDFDSSCVRIHTVGQDCSVGKMTTALEIERALGERGHDAWFLATGQTGIMIRGCGVPIDCVVADFVSGAAERLVLENQNHEFAIIEGQGSITHPSFSGVTLGLLHGCAPEGLILCYEAGRKFLKHLDHVRATPLKDLIAIYESHASSRHPCKVIGIAANTRLLSSDTALRECERVQDELGLPTCDIIRHGSSPLADAIVALSRQSRDRERFSRGRNTSSRVSDAV